MNRLILSTYPTRQRINLWLMLIIVAGFLIGLPDLPTAQASEPVEVGYRDFSFPSGTGGNSEPTGEKPESKLWWNDGFWWGSLWSTSGNAYHIYRLDLATQDWLDTGVAIDDRKDSRADALWDGQKLYVVSHIFAKNAGAPASSGQRGELFRYSYNSVTDTYSLDPGFPVEVTGGKSETLVVDKDSAGQLWVTYVENQKVMVNHSLNGDDSLWGTPFALPIAEATGLASDDISSIIAYTQHIGVMWSNQSSGKKMYFAVHPVGAPDNVWTRVLPYSVSGDDHMNLKSLQADNAGNVFAVIKTSRSAELIVLLVCKNNINRCKTESDWISYPVYQNSPYNPTRPILLIDTDNRELYVFTRNVDNGSGIYYKTADLDNIQFPDGIGVPFIKSATETNVNDPTSTKQNLNGTTGLVVLASDSSARLYLHNYLELGPPSPPAAEFAGSPLAGEAPLTVNFSDLSGGNPTAWAWDFGDGATSTEQHPSHTYINPGTYTISLTVSNTVGSDTATKIDYITVTAPPPPVANFEGTPTSGPAPLTVSFSDQSTGNPTAWTWDFGDGATSTEQHPSHTYANPGTYTVTLTVSNTAGSDTATKIDYITVNAPPPPVANFEGTPTSGPAPLTVNFNDLSTGNPTAWQWDFGDGATSTEQHPSHTYASPGAYTVSLAVTNLVGTDSQTRSNYITVTDAPSTLTFNPTDDAQVRSSKPSSNYGGLETLRMRVGSTAYNSYLKFNVTGLGGSVESAHLRLYVTDGSDDGGSVYAVSNDYLDTSAPWHESGLTWENAPLIEGNPLAAAGGVNIGEWIELEVSPAISGEGIYSFGLSSSSTNSVLYSSKEGSNPPELVLTINTGPLSPPVADFAGTPASGEAPLTVNFNDLSTGSPTAWQWDFGDGTTSTEQHPSHTYPTAGAYTVSLTVSNAAGSDTATKVDYITVTSPPPPTAEFSGSPLTGETPLTVNFSDLSAGNPTAWQWDFGDGNTSTEQHPSHTYLAAGTYTVSLTVSNTAGSDTSTKIDYITVAAPPPPTAEFSGSPLTGDAPLAVSFSDQSSGSPTAWQWDFGDGNTSTEQHPSHTYLAAGTYTVSLTVSNTAGSDTATKVDYITVTTPPPPVAEFEGTPASGEASLAVSFSDLSTGSPTAWLWDFGDGNTSTEQHPSHTYLAAGAYTVSLTVSNTAGSDTATKVDYITVTAPPPPVADFEGTPASGEAPLTVNFSDLSTGSPTAWQWDFGDGNTSTEQHPSHTYTNPGAYTVSLTVSNAAGSDTATKVDYITVTTPQFTLTVNIVGSGSVTLDPPGGLYEAGTVVTLTANPEPGFVFSGWSGDLSGTNNPETITMEADRNVTATFTQEQSGGGSVAYEETQSGASSSSSSVTTSAGLTGVSGNLYLAAISTKPNVAVSDVSGLGLTWTLARAQCSGRSATRVEVWMAQGTTSGDGPVTATFSGTPRNAVIAVSRYSGVEAANPIGNIVSGNTNGINGACAGGLDSSAYSFDLTTTVGGAMVYGATTMRNKSHTPGADYTERIEVQHGSGGDVASVAVMDKPVASPTTTAVDGSFSNTVDWAAVGLEIKPGSGG